MTRYIPSFIKQHSKEAILFIGAAIGILCVLSLYFYSPNDPSWFFYATVNMPIHNICGSIGACIAALLVHLFGTGAWIFLSMFFFMAYLFFIGCPLSDEWDRLVAFGIGLCAVCALHSVYHIGYHTGGLLGLYVYALLLRLADPLIVYGLLISSTLAASIIIMRDVLVYIAYAVAPVMRIMSSKRVWRPVWFVITFIVRLSIAPFKQLIAWLKSIADGSAVHNEKESVVTFEQAITYAQTHSTQWYEEQLWKEYTQPTTSVTPSQPAVRQDQEIKKEMPVMQPEEHNEAPVRAAKKDTAYRLPDLDIFIGVDDESDDQQLMLELEQRAKILEEKLERFGVSGKVVSIKRGPVVTLFEYKPHIDSKISKIIALEDDLALALQALSIRIIAPIPGRSVVGFEVANKHRKGVFLASVLQSPIFKQYSGALPLALGQDTIGNTVFVDLARMPHLLIAGSTGSGKSVALNAMLISLLCKLSPDQLRLILVDPKRLEFASYADIAHLLFPIVTNPKDAAPILRWVVRTMEERYECMAEYGVRSIDDFNKLGLSDQETMPYIVVIIDELSDLMMTTGKEIEDLIARITQMARAAGIHMIVATQRPSVDVITGLIKVNFPSRISFRVTSKIDSRTILDCSGADKLLGRGDMLFLDSCEASLRRIHGAYVSDNEIAELVAHIRKERPTDYLDISKEMPVKDDLLHDTDDELYQQVITFLDSIDEISISLLQRKFRIGYNRSARIIDQLEIQGFIEPSTGSKTRKVIR